LWCGGGESVVHGQCDARPCLSQTVAALRPVDSHLCMKNLPVSLRECEVAGSGTYKLLIKLVKHLNTSVLQYNSGLIVMKMYQSVCALDVSTGFIIPDLQALYLQDCLLACSHIKVISQLLHGKSLFMSAMHSRYGHSILPLWILLSFFFFLSSSFFFSSPILSRCILDIYRTILPHMMWP